jgi:hypothetical protein
MRSHRNILRTLTAILVAVATCAAFAQPAATKTDARSHAPEVSPSVTAVHPTISIPTAPPGNAVGMAPTGAAGQAFGATHPPGRIGGNVPKAGIGGGVNEFRSAPFHPVPIVGAANRPTSLNGSQMHSPSAHTSTLGGVAHAPSGVLGGPSIKPRH